MDEQRVQDAEVGPKIWIGEHWRWLWGPGAANGWGYPVATRPCAEAARSSLPPSGSLVFRGAR